MASGAKAGGTRDGFWERVNKYAGAKSAIDKLAKDGIEAEDLRHWLWVAAQMEWLWQQKHKRLRNTRLAGLPFYTLERLPGYIRDWGKQLSALRTGMERDPTAASILELVYPGANLALTNTYGLTAEELFGKLPEILSAYAHFIDVAVAIYRSAREETTAPMRAFRELFVYYVKSATGRPHLPEIETLLNAAFSASRIRGKVDQKVLAKSYSESTFIKSLPKESEPSAVAKATEVLKRISGSLARRPPPRKRCS